MTTSTTTSGRGYTVALAACAEFPDLGPEGPVVVGAFEDAGFDVCVPVWDDPAVDWNEFDVVVVRGTWDYVHKRDEFLAWARARSLVLNPSDILEWNTDKTYLADLAARGVPIVPTAFVSDGDPFDIPEGEVVVKPTVSAGGLRAALFLDGESDAAAAHVRELHDDSLVAMVQPYRALVDEMAEIGLVYIHGTFSHAIRKDSMLRQEPMVAFDYMREQVISARVPTSDEMRVAELSLDAVPGGRERLLYARVDLVPGPSGPELIELELTEPALYPQFGDRCTDLLTDAVVAILGASKSLKP